MSGVRRALNSSDNWIRGIYTRLVRTLDLGHRKVGFYLDRTRAAYWGGLNSTAEKVASGIYFYRLQAGDFNAMRRMVIVK